MLQFDADDVAAMTPMMLRIMVHGDGATWSAGRKTGPPP
jgi:hypothetical protein